MTERAGESLLRAIDRIGRGWPLRPSEARAVLAALADAHATPREPDGWVPIPAETARIIDAVFLPSNPNKLRKATPEVIAAAHEFKRLVKATPATEVSE